MALLVCLSTIILPPVLAIVLSAIKSLSKHYGEPLLRLLDLIGTLTAYATQLAMIIAALVSVCCIFGTWSTGLHGEMSERIVPLYRAALLFTLGLGCLTLTAFGLHLVEWAVWGIAVKKPAELSIVRLVAKLNVGSVRARIESAAETIILLLAGAKTARMTTTPQAGLAEEMQDIEPSDDETAVSDGALSDADRKQLFGIEHWK